LTRHRGTEDASIVRDPPPSQASSPAARRRIVDIVKEWSGATTALAGAASAVIAVLVAVGVVHVAKSGDATPTPTPTATASAAREVRVDPSAIRVTSRPRSLAPQGAAQDANDYIPDNMLDGDPHTAWVEGAPGLGLPARLTFALPERVDLQRITIVDGYAKDTAHLLDNAAAKTIEIRGGAKTLRYTLTRSRRPQTVRAPFGRTRTVVIRILSGYPGARFDDLAVSEVAFFAKR
jgi:hypothetical protein